MNQKAKKCWKNRTIKKTNDFNFWAKKTLDLDPESIIRIRIKIKPCIRIRIKLIRIRNTAVNLPK